ncbi:hypothetical protein [Prevotella jejuni]|uniref:hypothetical protein n=1 Tax=Prevotella jejuni TaxID=1177574 RepID=UPI001BA56710|nr:hypothetical protein [Prevotella jejuni]QUB79978.1 hypothetical protein J4857_11625 [Prevotella jejuni]
MKIMKKNVLFPVACFLMAAPLLTSCHDDVDSSTAENTTIHTYSLVADGANALQQEPATRVLSEDADHKIKSEWGKQDDILAYVVGGDNLHTANYSYITNSNLGGKSNFDGEIASSAALTTNSEIAFLYPGKAAQGNNRTITPVVKNDDKSSLYHEASDKTQKLVELNLSKQDGTAKTIGERFDFQWTKQKPKKVEGKKVDVSLGELKRIVTIWGLRFTNESNQPLTNIDSIYISNVKSSDVFNLDAGTFVENNFDDERTNLVIKPEQGQTLSSANGKYTYAAFIPGKYTDVVVMVFANNKVYQRTYSSITFNEGIVYRSDLLKMEEPKQKASVLVQGVQWATGNFIHYGPVNGGYWGIAPAQWWISKRAMYIDNSRNEANSGSFLVSSQFANAPEQTTDDVDLFRFGDIEYALNLSTDKFKSGKNLNIEQKFYVGDGPLKPETSDRSKAKNGDIVWYYTQNNHRQYRYPTETDILSLYNDANVQPAYCYTDKGTLVYGAYYTTNKGGSVSRINAFPTGVRAYDKYKNVTALVRANIGLFLPISGLRILSNKHMGFRDMTWGSGAYGQYMSSKATGVVQSQRLQVGPTMWTISNGEKAQASAIRPVLVSDDGQEDPVYPAFANIK